MTTLDLDWIRGQFPALAQEAQGQPIVFFDGPGGTQVPQTVIAAIGDYLVHANANTHGAFLTSQRTDATIGAARSAMADFLNCAPDEIVFGANMTALTFALSRAIGRTLQPGDEILVTTLDHSANVAPWQALAERGAVIRTVNIQPDCTLDLAHLKQLLTARTRLVAVGYASNAVGTVNDVQTIVQLAHEAGALVFVDAVHYAPHGTIDVQAVDCDFLACSAYKFFGPHLGVLYGKTRYLEQFTPYKVQPAPNQPPYCWETGTLNHEGLAGLVAAIDYLAAVGQRVNPACADRRAALLSAMSAIRSYEQQLAQRLISGLLQLAGVTIYGITDRIEQRTPTVGIRSARQSPQQLAQQLGDRGICSWSGNFYALGLTEALGLEAKGGLLRLGLVHYNTEAEVDRLLKALDELISPS